MAENKIRTFEECSSEIKDVIESKRGDWTFKASVMEDFDDFASEVLTHIWHKWELYDQSRPLGGWVATIVKNKFFNKLRDVYLSTSSPCARCPCNLGENTCSLYGSPGPECNLYLKWSKSKKHAHDARLPLPIEHHVDEVHSKPDSMFDIEGNVTKMHDRIQKKLTPSQWLIYKLIFVDGKDEEYVAKELDLKSSENGRKLGYKRIRQVKNIAFQFAKDILIEEGIE